LVPLRIFRCRTLAGADALTILIGAVAAGMPFVLTLYAQQVLGYSALKFGISPVVLALGATAGAIAGPAAVGKAGFGPAAATGLALIAAGSLVLMQVSRHGSYFPDIFVGLLLCGLGIGLAFVTATVAALAGVAEHEAGLASGLSNTALQTGTALGVAIVTTVAFSRSQHYLAADKGANPLATLTQRYQPAFLACAVLAGIGLALAFLLPGRPRKPAHELPEPDPAADAAAAGDVVIRSGTK
ncbi:MAG TPA: MFS transporter, partial [Ramlibacter sp.]|nr:MFS transporter [Ramlibacter sp.]